MMLSVEISTRMYADYLGSRATIEQAAKADRFDVCRQINLLQREARIALNAFHDIDIDAGLNHYQKTHGVRSAEHLEQVAQQLQLLTEAYNHIVRIAHTASDIHDYERQVATCNIQTIVSNANKLIPDPYC